jgi:hypothetical protein
MDLLAHSAAGNLAMLDAAVQLNPELARLRMWSGLSLLVED